MDINPVSPLPAAVTVFLAASTAQLLTGHYKPPANTLRVLPIDGLRGYLAFFVFLHHASIWYFYVKTGNWVGPPSNLYAHFGQSSVELFFMITGFLFFSKILDSRNEPIDWLRLYVSRVLRLAPLYLFAITVLVAIVLAMSDWMLKEPVSRFARGLIYWLGFTVFGAPDLNGVTKTFYIIAGVTWTFPYEWFFYLSLPILALTVRTVAPANYLALGTAGLLGGMIWLPQRIHLLAFLGGIIASILVKNPRFRQFCEQEVSSFIVLGIFIAVISLYSYAYGVIPLIFLSCGFSLIAGGTNFFGILIKPWSLTLGEMAYSIYLLHGATLFILINFLIGKNNASGLSALEYWLTIAGITPVLICFCYGTYRFIERPAMKKTAMLTGWLHAILPFSRRQCSK